MFSLTELAKKMYLIVFNTMTTLDLLLDSIY